MGSFSQIIFVYSLLVLIKPICSQQFYDRTNCSADSQVLGSNYLCTAQSSQCQAYIAYRAQENFRSLSSISALFNLNPYDHSLLTLNNMTEEAVSNTSLPLGREVIIPISCSCPDRFSRAIIMYNFSISDSFAGVACGLFQGLVKEQSLVEENPEWGSENYPDNATQIKVPIRCACPSEDQRRDGVKYLVTYPVMEKDYVDLMARKFGVSEQMIWEANRLQPLAAIFANTVLIIPTNDIPILKLDVVVVDSPQYPPPSPRDVISVEKDGPKSTTWKLYAIVVKRDLGVITLAILTSVLCLRFWKRNHRRSFQSLSPRSSQLFNFSPDFLDGMSKLKHSLIGFSLEELRIATEDFSEFSVIGSAVYRGRIGGSYIAIEGMSSEESARHVVDILTRINHQNVVKLEGCCFGTRSYLVLEFADNGSLRDCLSRPKMTKQLTWKIRMQIACDLAVGLHYVHYCTKPSYVHRNINSRNVLITADWRAKISGFRLAKPLESTEEKEEAKWTDNVIVGKNGYLAPEYYTNGLASAKVDIFAFGVVLVELLSGKETSEEGKMLTEFVRFFTDIVLEGSPGCLEKLKEFMDSALEDDYELSDAICLAFLAKACVEDDPHNRPTMNDVLKALTRIA